MDRKIILGRTCGVEVNDDHSYVADVAEETNAEVLVNMRTQCQNPSYVEEETNANALVNMKTQCQNPKALVLKIKYE